MIEIISDHKPTNADRIRGMSDRELAIENVIEIVSMFGCGTFTSWKSAHAGQFETKEEAIEYELKWLQQPAE